jgi:hypothetical protein
MSWWLLPSATIASAGQEETGQGETAGIDPALLRVELLADAKLGLFRPFRSFQGSTVPLPPDVARALSERAAPRLEALAPGGLAE